MSIRTHVIILNWKACDETIAAMRSVEACEPPPDRIHLVDNGSNDGSDKRLVEAAASCSLPTEVHLLDDNRGYAGGNNDGIGRALRSADPPTHLLLLNNDAVVRPGTIAALGRAVDASGAGIVGCRIERGDGSVQFGGLPTERAAPRQFFQPLARWPTPPVNGGAKTAPSYWVSGAGMLLDAGLARDLLDARGYVLDERLFLYFEELELCTAARDLGYDVVMARDAVVVHAEAHSSGGMHNPRSYYYITRNRIILANELLPLGWRILFHPYNLAMTGGRWLKNIVAGRPRSARSVVAGYRDACLGRTGKWSGHDTLGGPPGGPQ